MRVWLLKRLRWRQSEAQKLRALVGALSCRSAALLRGSRHSIDGRSETESEEELQNLSPPRTTLYRMEPYGVGTMLVESLTSYLCRLASAYAVPATRFTPDVWDVLRRHAPGNAPDHDAASLRAMRPSMLTTVQQTTMQATARPALSLYNGTDIWVDDAVERLTALTQMSAVRYTTMLPWRNVFPLHGELRAWRAWCPACYREWSATGAPVYEPLLWAFREVRICPVHRRRLISQCPHCRGRIPLVPRFSRPATCTTCHESLATEVDEKTPPHPSASRTPSGSNRALRSPPRTVAHPASRRTGSDVDAALQGERLDETAPEEWEEGKESDEWVAREIGELLAAMPKMAREPTVESAARWLQQAQYERYQFNTPALCAAALLADYVGYECITGTRRHHLTVWLRLFAPLQVSPDHHLAHLALGSSGMSLGMDEGVRAVWNVLAPAGGRHRMRDADGSAMALTQDAQDTLEETRAALDTLVRCDDATPLPSIVTIGYWLGLTLNEMQTRWPEQYTTLARRSATTRDSQERLER